MQHGIVGQGSFFGSFSSREKSSFRFAIPRTGRDEKRMKIRLIHFSMVLAVASAWRPLRRGRFFRRQSADRQQHDEVAGCTIDRSGLDCSRKSRLPEGADYMIKFARGVSARERHRRNPALATSMAP
jgi:hypothetical protein